MKNLMFRPNICPISPSPPLPSTRVCVRPCINKNTGIDYHDTTTLIASPGLWAFEFAHRRGHANVVREKLFARNSAIP